MKRNGMKSLVSAFLGMILLGNAGALAELSVPKVAVVDMQKALQTVEEGKKAKSQLETAFNSKKKELQNEESAIKKMGEEFKKQAAVMNDDARGKKQAEIQQKERDLTSPIINRLRGVIGEIAQSKGATVVLEKNENNVLFSLEKDDLTADVITAYNKKVK